MTSQTAAMSIDCGSSAMGPNAPACRQSPAAYRGGLGHARLGLEVGREEAADPISETLRKVAETAARLENVLYGHVTLHRLATQNGATAGETGAPSDPNAEEP